MSVSATAAGAAIAAVAVAAVAAGYLPLLNLVHGKEVPSVRGNIVR